MSHLFQRRSHKTESWEQNVLMLVEFCIPFLRKAPSLGECFYFSLYFLSQEWAFTKNFRFHPGVCKGFHQCSFQRLHELDIIHNVAKATLDLLVSPSLWFEHTAVLTPIIFILFFATLKSIYGAADISKANVFMSKYRCALAFKEVHVSQACKGNTSQDVWAGGTWLHSSFSLPNTCTNLFILVLRCVAGFLGDTVNQHGCLVTVQNLSVDYWIGLW